MGAVWFPVPNDLPAMLHMLELSDHSQYSYPAVAIFLVLKLA